MVAGISTNIVKLAELFGITSLDDLEARNDDYFGDFFVAARDEALKEGATETEADEAGFKADGEARDELYQQWHNGVTSAVEELFGRHHLEVVGRRKAERYPFEFVVRPVAGKTWADAADEIRVTINGVGYFEFRDLREFLDSGPWTAKQAVEGHLHWIKDYSEVYGTDSAQRIYERAFR